MTNFAPSSKSRALNILLMWASFVFALAVFMLVMLYNRSVNMSHALSDAKGELQKMKSEMADAKDKIFILLQAQNLEKFAEEQSLIKEKNPEYFRLSQQWASASR